MPFFAKNRHIPDAFDECKHRFFFTEREKFPEIHSPSWNMLPLGTAHLIMMINFDRFVVAMCKEV